MKIRTFPLHFTEDRRKNIEEAAKLEKLPMYQYIEKAIDEKMERDGKK